MINMHDMSLFGIYCSELISIIGRESYDTASGAVKISSCELIATSLLMSDQEN